MLIAPIDRNKAAEREKQINRIHSPYWTLPIHANQGSFQNPTAPHSSEGVILRVRDTRRMERRKDHSAFPKQERRARNNRKHDFRGDTASHHILIIAIERKAGEPATWKAGDRVSVVPKAGRTQGPQEKTGTSANTQKKESPLLVKDDEDYVLHLSKSYPAKR